MAWAWTVHLLYIYREANGCANVLAKRDCQQHSILEVYDTCPSFVYPTLYGIWITSGPVECDIWRLLDLLYCINSNINNTSFLYQKINWARLSGHINKSFFFLMILFFIVKRALIFAKILDYLWFSRFFF